MLWSSIRYGNLFEGEDNWVGRRCIVNKRIRA